LPDHCLVVLLLIVLVFFAGIVMLGLLVGRAKAKAERRRRDAFHAWAAAHGWRGYEGDVPAVWRWRLSHLRGFAIRRLAVTTAYGLAITAADCRYEVHSTDGEGRPQTGAVDISVFLARLPGRWPDIDVQDRGFGSRVLRALGKRPPVATGQPEFDRKFRVEAPDPRAVRLLSPALVRAHLKDQVPLWSLRGGELMFWEERRLAPEEIGPGVDCLRWLAGALGHRG
jgi:hypothetical protein